MRPVTVAIPASGASPTVPLDLYLEGPITVMINAITGTPDIDVQYTLDDPYDTAVTPTWIDAGAPLNAVAAAAAGALVDAGGLPIRPRAIRALNNNAASGGNMIVTQAGLIT